MDYYAGIDVSLEQNSVCVVDSLGKIVRETKVASEPEALQQHFANLGLPVVRVGLEAGPLSQWLRECLVDAGLDVVLLETNEIRRRPPPRSESRPRHDRRSSTLADAKAHTFLTGLRFHFGSSTLKDEERKGPAWSASALNL